MKKPIIKGYYLSQDYNFLWDLINEGHRIAAWIIYSDEFKEPIYDLVEVRINPIGDYNIGSRGIGYSGLDEGFEGFLLTCKSRDLKFITPTNL